MEKTIIDRVFAAVSHVTGIAQWQIFSGARIREYYQARMITAYQLKRRGLTADEIRPLVGVRRTADVYRLLSAYAEEITPYFIRCAENVQQLLNEPIISHEEKEE